MKKIILICTFSLLSCANTNFDKIKDQMIKESISRYSGSCPCPYNTTRNGSRCGGRSAYSKPGGYTPLCYKIDIDDEMVKKYLNLKK